MAARKKKKALKKQKTKKAKKVLSAKRGKTASKAQARAKTRPAKKKAAKAKAAPAGKAAGKKKTQKKMAPKKTAASRKTAVARSSATKSSVAPKARVQAKPVAAPAPKPAKKPARAPAPKVPVALVPVAVAAVPVAPKAAERSTYYLTTAISYPNGVPHIGHAYEAIATDALARFQRLNGKDVFFLTGTDEHGLKMVQTAARENLSVQDFAARNAGRFKAMDERLNVSFSRFIRTTEEQHHRSSQVLWNRVQQAGDIYPAVYSGWYSVRDEAYYGEEETTVGEDNVRRGPQGSPVEWVDERSYFFKLSAYQDRLLKLYEEQPDFIGRMRGATRSSASSNPG
jgi:methionyl-tRNA synthetase